MAVPTGVLCRFARDFAVRARELAGECRMEWKRAASVKCSSGVADCGSAGEMLRLFLVLVGYIDTKSRDG